MSNIVKYPSIRLDKIKNYIYREYKRKFGYSLGSVSHSVMVREGANYVLVKIYYYNQQYSTHKIDRSQIYDMDVINEIVQEISELGYVRQHKLKIFLDDEN